MTQQPEKFLKYMVHTRIFEFPDHVISILDNLFIILFFVGCRKRNPSRALHWSSICQKSLDEYLIRPILFTIIWCVVYTCTYYDDDSFVAMCCGIVSLVKWWQDTCRFCWPLCQHKCKLLLAKWSVLSSHQEQACLKS
jgi:hypothetical protein